MCDPAKFRIVLDVGHTAESEGAISSRNVPEFVYNLRLARRIEEKLKAVGFAETRLLLTEGKARPSLAKRVAATKKLHANLFLSIRHDSVPDSLLENWEFEGKKSHFSDRFSGYSVFVSRDNPHFRTSLSFAELVGTRGCELIIRAAPAFERWQTSCKVVLQAELEARRYDRRRSAYRGEKLLRQVS